MLRKLLSHFNRGLLVLSLIAGGWLIYNHQQPLPIPAEEQGPKTTPLPAPKPLVSVAPPQNQEKPAPPSETVEHPTSHSGKDRKNLFRTQKDPYAGLPVLSFRETVPDADGNFERYKVVKTDMKYPLIRVEEKWVKNFSTQEEIRKSQVAMAADHLMVKAPSIQALESLGYQIINRVGDTPVYVVKFKGQDVDALPRSIEELKRAKVVENVGPDYILRAN